MFRHPKYYKELRKLRNKLDQAISKEPATAVEFKRSPGPGPVKLFRGSQILELAACGLELEACCLSLEACGLLFESLGA